MMGRELRASFTSLSSCYRSYALYFSTYNQGYIKEVAHSYKRCVQAVAGLAYAGVGLSGAEQAHCVSARTSIVGLHWKLWRPKRR
ncbi:hypothetical protein J6590_037262 [Homalodisca vitripennis]|nr:hypothetical protein J6590_037262 [Homalodisca vitripennis]